MPDAMTDDTDDIIRVPRARLREVKDEIDALQTERDRLTRELAELQEEHRNLRAHLTGSLKEVARLTEENETLRGA
ncbi:MAG TPA: hypothetical protein VF576_09500 [Rubricoccaceae bacterium]|jgi:uncharacterized coiled-coil DUF342 family protein